ncbi:hypothetical protein LINPERPRIM_LOCUS32816 [Linum perenne]
MCGGWLRLCHFELLIALPTSQFPHLFFPPLPRHYNPDQV